MKYEGTHELFVKYGGWSGNCPASCHATYLGQLIRKHFINKNEPESSMELAAETMHKEAPWFPPVDNEEYFEHVASLSAVDEASDSFVMMELGAGYGRWLVHTALAMRRGRNLPVHLVGVEADPQHFAWLRLHFLDNGIDPDAHIFISAPVAAEAKKVLFAVGNSAEWYGQSIVPPEQIQGREAYLAENFPHAKIQEMTSVTLNDLLAEQKYVDLIDMDIQGEEFEVVASARDAIQQKVKRMFIGTHGRLQEYGLRKIFSELGWFNVYDYPSDSQITTNPGIITSFQDGVQYWINPALVPLVPEGARVYTQSVMMGWKDLKQNYKKTHDALRKLDRRLGRK
ncbi:hypothetical protein FACS189491_09610 [Spirochaetia bacterium]|nr:hypothetical protein FACS189491_09610 [Spirochaetia bacterium]